jgi:hypothetical protein
MNQPWQLRALTYYNTIGEVRFASQFYAKLISRVRYYPARQMEDGKTEPITEGLPVDLSQSPRSCDRVVPGLARRGKR